MYSIIDRMFNPPLPTCNHLDEVLYCIVDVYPSPEGLKCYKLVKYVSFQLTRKSVKYDYKNDVKDNFYHFIQMALSFIFYLHVEYLYQVH